MNTLYTAQSIYKLLVLLVLVAGVPLSVYAQSYTWGGQTFATEKEMNAYILEYVHAYKELYGTTDGITKTPQASSAKKTVTSTQNIRTTSDVNTRGADMVTTSGVRLSGSVKRAVTGTTKVWFMYGTDKNNLWFATAPEVLKSGFGSKYFDRQVSGLVHDTTYYYRAVIERDGLRSYGAVRSFVTLVDVRDRSSNLRVGSVGVSEVTDNRAIFTMKPSLGKEGTYATVWYEYGDDASDLYKKTPSRTLYQGDRAAENMTYTVRGLEDATIYYVRAVGYDERGVKNYSAIRSFKTRVDIVGEKPRVETFRAGDVTQYSATLGGRASMNDFRNGTAFVVYGEDKNAIMNVSKLYDRYARIKTDGDSLQKLLLDNDLDSEDSYTAIVVSLDFKTTHYYALGVEYTDGNKWIVLGNIQSFTTKQP